MKRLLAAIPLALCAPAQAAHDLDTIIVTATRTELAASQALASVIVIDRDTIERSLANDVAELLRFHAGLELGRNGGPGQATSLFMRGTESNHAIVLLDGVEINPGTIGGAALQNISPLSIERIEIVKGPRSTLYGSEAIGGVVNVITGHSDGLSLELGAGRYDSRDIAMGAGVTWRSGTLTASASRSHSDGFPSRREPGLPDRGFDNFSAGFNASVEAGTARLGLRHWHSDGQTEYFDFFLQPLEQRYLNRASALEVLLPRTATWAATLSLSQIVDDIEQRQGPDFATTRRDVADWQNTLTLGAGHELLAGLYVARERTRAVSFGTAFDERTDVEALYLSDQLDFGRNRVLLAGRYTRHAAAGDGTTWNAEFGRALSEAVQLTVAAGTAFRAPDATDRFGFGGNPELEPERSRSFEIGLRGRWTAHTASLTVFRNDIEDLIEFVFDPLSFAGGNLNVASARIRGLEASHSWRGGPWQITTTALVQDPRDRGNGRQLARRARRTLTLTLERDFGPHSAGLDVLTTSARPDSPASDTVNAGYVLANLTAVVQVSPRWSLNARLENLLDTDYETAAGFRSAARGLYVALRYRTR